jgi:glucoamylase
MSTRTIAPGATWRRVIAAASICAVVIAAAWLAAPALATPRALTPSGEAPGAPGATSYRDTARKDCFGTARNTTSKVWFTVAGGVLSDV